MQLPVSLDADDQDFMPNKKPRTLGKGQDEHARSSHACAMACKVSSLQSTGKENQPPVSHSAESNLQHHQQQGQSLVEETLPLRIPGCSRKSAGSLLVRSFFTKAKHTPTGGNTAAHSSSTKAGSSAQSANHLQQSSQSSTKLEPHQHGTACAAETACASGMACTAGSVLSPLPGNFIVLDASDSEEEASDDGEFADLHTQAVQSDQAVLAWLHQHGLASYAAAFSQAEVDMNLIPCLTDADLKLMGVSALGPRRKILAAASKLSVQTDAEEPCEHGARSSSDTAVSKASLNSGPCIALKKKKETVTVALATVCQNVLDMYAMMSQNPPSLNALSFSLLCLCVNGLTFTLRSLLLIKSHTAVTVPLNNH